ncbi:cobalt ECF transporter T component CbiQ [Halochromatium glycolicum]|uniref:Cobalt ECF transporter T component CbiQ n=1 Tax=Halochromatium glycolicum TaxID=85075 RepID=A0AAJ0XCC2_9GAMM|nr:cobalt ECF transporter T component CbiQ [Halochromatium glycolicum]MBK1706732.1 cobalt ECF transporter T component CbiQ [Halochromatium glycolicum]
MSHLGDPSAPLLGAGDRTHPARGPIQTLDPRARILAVIGFAGVVILLDQPVALGVALALALTVAALARLPLRRTLRQLAAMDAFVLLMLLMLPFTTPGHALFALGPLTASAEGLRLAVDIALTANAILLMLLALVGELDPVVIGHALHRLRMPTVLVQLLQFTVRYVGLIDAELDRMRIAMRARGFVPGTNWHTYRSLGYALGMLLVRSLERAERVLCAMKCRGFSGRFPVLDTLHFRRIDAGLAALTMLALTGLLLLEWRLG